jgi:tetratricopeptide (TPR) repeat protein
MARDDWFRNTEWDDAIEMAFFQKLQRARNKSQYLRIQASMLANAHPKVALRLLDSYFALGEHFDYAQAHVDRAEACLALGDTAGAIAAYEAALVREQQYPRLLTYAWLDLPFLIIAHRIRHLYARALELLHQHSGRVMFPVDRFRWHAACALICVAQGESPLAKKHAQQSLAAASDEHSGFVRHPTVGLVGTQYAQIREQLLAVVA